MQKISAAWNDMNRRIVNGGFKRKAGPPSKKKHQSQQEYDDLVRNGDWDYAFEYSNDKIKNINQTSDIIPYIRKQQLKWIAHVCRMTNNSVQKQLLFTISKNKNVWTKVEKLAEMDASQFRGLAMDRKKFLKWLEGKY